MAGKPWSEERRRHQSELTRQQMASPSRRKLQSKVMKRTRAKMEQARRDATYTGEWRQRQSSLLRSIRADAATENRRKENARAAVKAYHALQRLGGPLRQRALSQPIPEDYRDTYDYLVDKLGISPDDAREIVRIQFEAETSPVSSFGLWRYESAVNR